MTFIRTYTIMCDDCGEEGDFQDISVPSLRAYAHQLGWQHGFFGADRKTDLCPDCWEHRIRPLAITTLEANG